MNRTIFLPLFAIGSAFAAMASQPIHAQGLPPAQNIDQLEQMVVTSLGADIGQPGGPMAPIDRRMRLAACPTGIQIDPPAMSAVTIRCTTSGWRIRVPLTRNIARPDSDSARNTAPMQTANADIRRGDPVELVAQGDSFRVSIDATAMEDANIGGRVRVSTGLRGATMFAQVVDVGRVRLMGFK